MGHHVRHLNLPTMHRGRVPLLILFCLILSQVATAGPAASVPVAHAAGNPIITQVLITGSTANPTIAITGSNFGSAPAAAPTACTYGTGSDYGTQLHLADSAANPHAFDAGLVDPTQSLNDYICLDNLVYSDTNITFTFNTYYTTLQPTGFYQLNAGDAFTVYVAGVSCSGTVTFGTAVSCGSITSVAFGGAPSAPTITVNGSNFGSLPSPYGTQPNAAYLCGSTLTGSNFAYQQYGFNDTTVPWGAGQANPTPGNTVANCIGIMFSSYSPTQVTFSFGSAYGTNGWTLFGGNAFTVFVAGGQCSGTVSYTAAVTCASSPVPPPAPSLTLAETHPGTSTGTFGTTIFGQISGATPSTTYSVSFYTASTCGAQPGTLVGTTSVTTDGSGAAAFSPTVQGPSNTTGTQIAATVSGSSGPVSPLSACITAVQGNDSWDTAAQLWADTATGSQNSSVATRIYTQGQERWYDFPVQPGAQVHINFNGPTGSVISLHTDIRQLYNGLSNPATASKLAADLAIQDAPSGYLPSGYLPSGYLPSGYLPSGYLPSGYLPSGYLPSGYLPSGYLPSGYLPSGYLPSGYLPSGYLPSGYLPSGYLPSGYLPSGYLPSGYLPGAYASAPRHSLMAIATSPTASVLSVDRNTWDLTGHLYVRVAGPLGAFTLTVRQDGGVCGGITPVSGSNGSLPTTTVNGAPPQTLILWDSARWDAARGGNSAADVSTLQAKMATFAGRSDVNGQVIDLHQFARVVQAQSQADSNTACPAAKNLVATEIKSIVQSYRDAYQASGATTIKYIVLVGDDHAIPFFRYPDESGLASENGYVPPVSDGSPTQAGLRNNYVLGQDEYGSSTSIPRGDHALPVPDMPVGRLVDTAAEASHMLDAYTATNGVITPRSGLVTGYDFVADAATSASAEISAGINQAGCGAAATCVSLDQLIAPQGVASTSPLVWTAGALRQKLYGSRHDIVFLAGHFSTGNLLASDYSTQLSAAEVAASTADLSNSLVLALGCHSGLNIPGQDAVSGVSPSPDWPAAMADRGATLLAATGYAYGDTVLTEYGERLFVDVTRQLRTGTGNVPIGMANVAAKQNYLNTHIDLSGIDEKTLLETTLYGLPMLQVNMPGQRLVAPTSNSIVSSTAPVTTGPGAAVGLAVGQTAAGSPDIAVAPTTTLQTTQLSDTNGNNPVTASWLSGASGVVAHALDPVFPLQLYNATVPNQVLRGIGFRSGSFTDLAGKTPLTVAPTTETSIGHPTFFSDVFYPTQIWSANYFDTIDGLNGGLTSLAVAPAQYQSSSPGSTSGTIRQFTALTFRLYYLSTGALSSQIATGAALDSAANIVGAASARDSSGAVTFQARVQNGLLPGGARDLQNVWVTYYDPASGTSQWTSVDLTQDGSDPSLWAGTMAGLSNGTVFIVQAANATGLVSLNTNNGAYFTVAPATPPPPPVVPVLTIQSSSNSGAYQSPATFTVKLTQASGAGLAGQAVTVRLGTQALNVMTGSDGSAQASMTLALGPGRYSVSASYSGSATYSGVSAQGSEFTIQAAPTTLTLTPSTASATYSSSETSGIAATLQANGAGLAQKSVYFTVAGPGGAVTHLVTITDANGNAALSGLSLPVGSYTINAAFGSAITDPAVAYTDPYYLGGSTTASSSLTITQASQAIGFGSLPNHLLGDASISVSATGGGSGNAVTFSAGPSAVCTSSGSNGASIAIVGVGTCTVTANQLGNANYQAAAPVAQSFTVAYPPLYMSMVLTTSPPGPITTGTSVTDSFVLGNHTATTQRINVNATLTYTGNQGSQSVTNPISLSLRAGQTLSQSVRFAITKSFPRGTYMLMLTAIDGSGHTATSSVTLNVT